MKHALRIVPFAALLGFGSQGAFATGIRVDERNMVPACATPGRLMAYLRHRNPALDRRFDSIALHYMREGQALGVRWDYAFFQMIVETGSLTFRRGDGRPGAVSPQQNNFAGLGATGGREPGESFRDVATGVRAHLQHVVLYTGAQVSSPVAERTRKVQEWGVISGWQRSLGRPTTFRDLARQWAPDSRGYWHHIESVAFKFGEQFCDRPDPDPVVAEAPRRTQQAAAEPPQPPLHNRVFEMARKALEPAPPTRSGLGAAHLEPPSTVVQPPQRQAAVTPPAAPPAVAPATPAVAVAPPAIDPMPPKPRTAEDAANEKLRQLVSGRTVNLDTPIGTVIPIEFGEDGRMRGKAGGLAGFLGSATDEGDWWIDKGKLCQRWKVWFKGEQQCLKFKQSGQTIHWVSDNGRSGTARLVNP